MDTKDKITIENLIKALKPFFNDTFHADVRKCRDEVRVRFPNGQKFLLYISDRSDEAINKKFEEMMARMFLGLPGEDYNQKFENAMMNWIRRGIWQREEIEAEQKDNQTFVTLKTGQEYVITIQRK